MTAFRSSRPCLAIASFLKCFRINIPDLNLAKAFVILEHTVTMAAEAVDPPQGSQIDAGNHPDPDHPQCSAHGDSNNLEATELRRIKSRYTSSTAIRRPASITPRPNSGLGLVRYEVSKFWKNQISIIVPHDTCRDHLGMRHFFLAIFPLSPLDSGFWRGEASSIKISNLGTETPFRQGLVLSAYSCVNVACSNHVSY